MIYAQHEGAIPTALVTAKLAHLVIGERLYLADPRRTPAVVQACDPATASFTVYVWAFEDAGAEWTLPLWDVSKFLVQPDARNLSEGAQRALGARIDTFQQKMRVATYVTDCRQTQKDITAQGAEIESWLTADFPDLPTDADAFLTGETADPKWSAALENIMRSKQLLEIDRAFVAQYASNPNAGEIHKGHRIVLAELGLCPYDDFIPRDPNLFEGQWSKAKRATHIITRLAFMRVLVSRLKLASVPLFRTIYSDDALLEPVNKGFVSSTFSPAVAAALFASGQKANYAASYWQKVPPERLFASYFETPELSAKYAESEAVLLFDPSNKVF